MKRTTAIILTVIILLAMALTACKPAEAAEKLSVVCTIFPQYDWVGQILGDKAGDTELTMLINNDADLHSFQPSADDIVKISTCDLFIYVGGESDEWVGDVLKEAANEDMTVINLLEALGSGAKVEEILEGMQEDPEHDHDHGAEEDHGDEDHGDEDGHEENHADDHEEAHEEEAVYDEHVWLSLRNAQTLCGAIADALSALDADNAGDYRSNLTEYVEELKAMDEEYQAVTAAAPVKTLLFGDRFPFRYMMDDYGLTPYAAFSGCSAETEASFDTIVFLAKKTDELKLKNIMVLESSDQSIATTVRDNTAEKNQQILVLDAMQSVSSDDINSGVTYLSIAKSNLDVLKEALK